MAITIEVGHKEICLLDAWEHDATFDVGDNRAYAILKDVTYQTWHAAFGDAPMPPDAAMQYRAGNLKLPLEKKYTVCNLLGAIFDQTDNVSADEWALFVDREAS